MFRRRRAVWSHKESGYEKDAVNGIPYVMSMIWCAVYTKPRQEDRVEGNLRNASFEVLNPKLRKKRLMRGGFEFVVQPFFPCYIFVRFDPDLHYRLIKYTRGVRKIVGNPSVPWPVSEEIISIIRLRINDDGYVEVRPDIKVGDRVEILDSSLKGFAGIFERETKDTDRVMVLLNTIEYQARIAIEREFLKKIDASS